jgi:hypothetical protein
MREVLGTMFPIGTILFALVYFLLINPDQFLGVSHWVENFF